MHYTKGCSVGRQLHGSSNCQRTLVWVALGPAEPSCNHRHDRDDHNQKVAGPHLELGIWVYIKSFTTAMQLSNFYDQRSIHGKTKPKKENHWYRSLTRGIIIVKVMSHVLICTHVQCKTYKKVLIHLPYHEIVNFGLVNIIQVDS